MRAGEPLHLSIDASSAADRGRARGQALREVLPGVLELYSRLFASIGVTERQLREHAGRIGDSVARWHEATAAELAGVAAGSGLEPWNVLALNGRTEILALAGSASPECSTLVVDPTPESVSPFGIQTWDWHDELSRGWHTQSVAGTRVGYTGLTEAGILAKIGINDAGVGVFFNILGHHDDAPTAVPIHLLAARLLADAESVAEAIDIVAQTPMASSGALTLVDRESVACVEISPAGTAILVPRNGFVAHTNHFLAASNAVGEKSGLYDPDSQQRLALIEARMADAVRAGSVPTCAVDLAQVLRSGPGEPQLCCVPSPDAQFGDRWSTLATIALSPASRTAQIKVGSPVADTEFRTMVAPGATVGGLR